jgi:hypothetical protein
MKLNRIPTALLVLVFLMLVSVSAQEDEVRAAMQAQLDAPKLRSIITYQNGEATHDIVEYVAPNSFRMVTSSTEMIIIADKTYQKEADAPWELLEMDMGTVIVQNRNTLDEAIFSVVQTLGVETINGKACKVYSYTLDFMGLIQQNKLWVEKSSGLPLRLENKSELEVGGQKISGVSDFEYDDSLEITVPIQ